MISLGFGLGLTNKKLGAGLPTSFGPLQVDGFDVLVDTFPIVFA
jgi:hypothetical protein